MLAVAQFYRVCLSMYFVLEKKVDTASYIEIAVLLLAE